MDLAVTQQLAQTQPELAAQLRHAKATLLETVELKRRIVEDLRPSLLDNLGLCAAIESYCEDFARMSSVRCETDVAINIDNREATLTIALFRIVQESLTNILKYARAGMVSVTFETQRARPGAARDRRRHRHHGRRAAKTDVARLAGHARAGPAVGGHPHRAPGAGSGVGLVWKP